MRTTRLTLEQDVEAPGREPFTLDDAPDSRDLVHGGLPS